MARAAALAAAIVVSLLAVSGAGGADAQTPKRGGAVVASRPEMPCLNPFACAVADTDPALTQVLEGAFEVGPDLVARPNLVSRVSIDRKPFTLTYHVRPEARWSDGVPVSASDFLFTHENYVTLETPAFDVREFYGKVRRARVLDAKTFRIELREPFADWQSLYPIVLPRHALVGRDLTKVWIDRIDNPKTGAPIGSGPFLVGRLERGKQLTLVRNPRYWGPHTAYLDRFVFRFNLDPRDPLGPLRRGELDFTLAAGAAFISEEVAREVVQVPGWRVAAWPAPAMEHLVFRVRDGGHPALRNKLVRQALAFGIDRIAIARAILGEAAVRARRPLDSTVFLPDEPYYRPNWSGYRYEPARARRLLEQAGCRRGPDGIYSCDGERLRLRFVTTAGTPVREQVLQLAHAHLRRVGVEVVLTFASIRRSSHSSSRGASSTPGSLRGSTLGGFAWPEARCGDSQNWAGFCSRLIMRDVQQTEFIVDPQQRARVLNAADVKLARAVPVLPVVQPVLRAAIRTSIRGFVPGGSQLNVTQNSEDWWLAEPR